MRLYFVSGMAHGNKRELKHHIDFHKTKKAKFGYEKFVIMAYILDIEEPLRT